MSVTENRKQAELKIKNTAKSKGFSVDKIIHAFLTNSAGALTRYVLSKNEIPLANIKQLIVQATLLRYAEINLIAETHKISEAEALLKLEKSEDEKLYNNLTNEVLPPEISAAINIIIEQKQGSALKNVGGKINNSKRFNGFTQTNSEPWLGDDSNVTYTDSSGGWDKVGDIAGAMGSIFSVFNQVVDSVNRAKSTATNTINSVGDAINSQVDTFGNKVSDIGGDSITKSLKDNLPVILMILAVIVLIIVMAIYASKRK